MLCAVIALALLLGTPTAGAGELLTSPCVGTRRPGEPVRLATLHAGAASWTPSRDASFKVPEPEEPTLVCLPTAAARGDRQAIVAIGNGAALFAFIEPSALTEVKLDDATWKRFRFPEDQGMQTGCLKKFPPGTALFIAPAGRTVGALLDKATLWGRWGATTTAGAGWSKLRMGVYLGPTEVWVKDSPGGWCPD